MTAWIIPLYLYFGVLGLTAFFLCPPLRKKLYLLPLPNKLRKLNYESNLHYLVIFRQVLLFFFPFCVALAIFGVAPAWQQLTSLFVLGLSLNVAWISYLPMMTKANLYIDFSVDELKDLKPEITVKAESEHIIYARIYNLGFSTLKNTLVLIYFGQGFEIIPYEDDRYKKLDFSKYFSIQEGNCGVAFPPTHENYQCLSPQEWFLFPVIIKTPKSQIQQSIEIQLCSENSWGLTKCQVPIHVITKS